MIFLVEGTPDVIRLAEAGFTGVACLNSSVTRVQLEKLTELNKIIIVAFDRDDAGDHGWEILCKAVKRKQLDLRLERFPVPPPFKDVGDMPAKRLGQKVDEYLERTGLDQEYHREVVRSSGDETRRSPTVRKSIRALLQDVEKQCSSGFDKAR
jgi:DNA primase